MKKTLPACMLAAAFLSSCSLMQRSPSESADSEHADAPPFAGQKKSEDASDLAPSYEAEISRMSTKLAALETKVDVLSANLEKAQLRGAQPVIEGALRAGAMAAPVEDMGEPIFDKATAAAAEPVTDEPTASPIHQTALPGSVKGADAPAGAVEKEFRSAMDLFQSGQNLEASSRFALFTKKYPRHLLASHALYWAGEASARGQQWALAIQNWEELQRNYPRSAYTPESLAGLARANEKQGDIAKAQAYKAKLLSTFPKSPVALSLNSAPVEARGGATNHRAQFNDESEDAPVFSEGASNGEAGDE